MKSLFYEQWKNKRLNKIINIFGEQWFADKNVLELGCAHGDIGIELLKLGSNVVFSDVRMNYLEEINNKLKFKYNYSPEFALINQNDKYKIDKEFDLVLHLGVLYHLTNWKNDLKCALDHSNIMILESNVYPFKDMEVYENNDLRKSYPYNSINDLRPVITQEEIENELNKLGCKYLRFDDSSLNIEYGFVNNEKLSFIYDWDYKSYHQGHYEKYVKENSYLEFKRFWLVLK